MNKRTFGGSMVGLFSLERTSWAQAESTPYNPSGGEMIFILLLTALVVAAWVLYEWVRRHRPA